jgi:hypothetical protein
VTPRQPDFINQGANSDRRMETSDELEDERMVSYVPLLVLSEEAYFFSLLKKRVNYLKFVTLSIAKGLRRKAAGFFPALAPGTSVTPFGRSE